MTEAEWMTATKLRAMFRAAWARAKRRLFAVACCRLIDPPLPDPRSRTAIDVAERHADGLATDAEFAAAAAGAASAVRQRSDDPDIIAEALARADGHDGKLAHSIHWSYRVGMTVAGEYVTAPHPYQAAIRVGGALLNTMTVHRGPSAGTQADILRDIFGNPFRPVAFAPAWRTSTAVALAQQMYESRDFSAMPILAGTVVRRLLRSHQEGVRGLPNIRGPRRRTM
jgi:hypothetical protein